MSWGKGFLVLQPSLLFPKGTSYPTHPPFPAFITYQCLTLVGGPTEKMGKSEQVGTMPPSWVLAGIPTPTIPHLRGPVNGIVSPQSK